MSLNMIREVCTDDFDSIYLLLEQLWPDDKLNKEDLFEVYQLSMESNTNFLFVM